MSVRLFFEIHSTKLKQRTKKNDFTLLSFESADMNDLKHSEKINNMAVNDVIIVLINSGRNKNDCLTTESKYQKCFSKVICD